MTSEEFNEKYDVHGNNERMCYTCAYCKRIQKKEDGEEKFVCLFMQECGIDANEVDDQLECSHYDEHSVGIPFDLDKYEDYKAKHKAKAKFDIEKYRKLHEDVKEFDKPSENYDDITVEELMEWQAIQNEKLFKQWLYCDDDLIQKDNNDGR